MLAEDDLSPQRLSVKELEEIAEKWRSGQIDLVAVGGEIDKRNLLRHIMWLELILGIPRQWTWKKLEDTKPPPSFNLARDSYLADKLRARQEWISMNGFSSDEYYQASQLAYIGVLRSRSLGYEPFASALEGYTALKEEMDELRKDVNTVKSAALLEAMREQVVQIAAMAIAFLVEVAE